MMDRNDFRDQMKRIVEQTVFDNAACHAAMDALMCQALQDQGYEEGVRVFEQQEKKYG